MAGRALRATVPRSSHADGGTDPGRNPIGILATQAAERVPELIGIRHTRMAESPFGFLRGAAAVMAADLVSTPCTGLSVQLCGDAHIRNFGTFGTPERRLSFSINDFDETIPGPWEWDVKRFAASLYVVASAQGLDASACRGLVVDAIGMYRHQMHRYAHMTSLDVWYDHKGIDDVLINYDPETREQVERDIAKAFSRGHDRAVRRLAETRDDGSVRFREDPPITVRLDTLGLDLNRAMEAFDQYRRSLPDDKQVLIGRYRLVDLARRVVGVGSVGTLVWVGLLEASSSGPDDRIVLQIKQAAASVLEPYVGASLFDHPGRRVVAGQRLTQGPTDSFLGWCGSADGLTHYYVRQLWDRKGRSDLTRMSLAGLRSHARLCAWALARAHARSGEPAAISGYLGKSDVFDRAVAVFAERYAARTVADHALLVEAIADGALTAT
jgi:uncharacterized protein (DUF2252 family)